MDDRWDAIVIGGGHNGLVAAITLAEHGRSVLVCEAQRTLGGAVATEELTRPGFAHDTYSSVYPASVASPVLTRMPLSRYGLEWVHPQVIMAHPFEGGRAAALHADVGTTAQGLDEISRGDGAAWQRFVSPWLRSFPALRGIMLGGFPPLAGAARLLARKGITGTLEFLRLVLAPAEALGDELFSSPEARAWLYGSALHGDVAPDDAGSAIAGVYLNLMGHAVGWPSPKGGARRLVDALTGYLSALGGQTRTGARVERIVTRRGRVAGVRLAGGDALRADIVIASLTPQMLVRLAGDGLPATYRAKLARYRRGPGTVKLDWALSGAPPWEAPVARRAGTIHVGGAAGDIVHAIRQRESGSLPDKPFLLFGQPSVADPTRAPAGNHTAWAYTRVPHDIDWRTHRERFAERMQQQVERFAPGFGDLVLERSVLTPPDMQARNASLEGGDVGAGSYALHQVLFRPVPAVIPYRTPVRGLYIGSAAAFPGGAVHGVPGHAAARVALAERPLRRLW